MPVPCAAVRGALARCCVAEEALARARVPYAAPLRALALRRGTRRSGAVAVALAARSCPANAALQVRAAARVVDRAAARAGVGRAHHGRAGAARVARDLDPGRGVALARRAPGAGLHVDGATRRIRDLRPLLRRP